MKGATQVDYVIALGIFIMAFGLIVTLTTDYYTNVTEISKIVVLRSGAIDMMDSLGREPLPLQWTTGPDVLGLGGSAYSFYILVNNTSPHYNNTGVTAQNLSGELVSFNYSQLSIDVNSTVIYNETGHIVPYNMSGNIITFNVSVNAGEVKWFTVYYDDTSNFTARNISIQGANNLTEKIYPAREIAVIEYREIQKLQNAAYTSVKSSIGMKDEFSVEVFNTVTNETFMAFGGTAPTRGNVISLERPVVFQNSTAAIIRGKIIVKVW